MCNVVGANVCILSEKTKFQVKFFNIFSFSAPNAFGARFFADCCRMLRCLRSGPAVFAKIARPALRCRVPGGEGTGVHTSGAGRQYLKVYIKTRFDYMSLCRPAPFSDILAIFACDRTHINLLENGTGKEKYRIYQRRDRCGMATPPLHPCGYLCQDLARGLPPVETPVGGAGELHDRQDHRAGGAMSFGGAVVPEGLTAAGAGCRAGNSAAARHTRLFCAAATLYVKVCCRERVAAPSAVFAI